MILDYHKGQGGVDTFDKNAGKFLWTSAPPPVTCWYQVDVLLRAGGLTLYDRLSVENNKDTWRLIFTNKLLETVVTASNRESH